MTRYIVLCDLEIIFHTDEKPRFLKVVGLYVMENNNIP